MDKKSFVVTSAYGQGGGGDGHVICASIFIGIYPNPDEAKRAVRTAIQSDGLEYKDVSIQDMMIDGQKFIKFTANLGSEAAYSYTIEEMYVV